MPTISQISEQQRRPNRRNVFLDGKFSFGCNVNVIARFRLREGMTLDSKQVDEIRLGAVTQECFDAAMRLLTRRLHSREELLRKLGRQEWGAEVIEAALQNLQRRIYRHWRSLGHR